MDLNFKDIAALMVNNNPRESVTFCQRLGLIRQENEGPSCGNLFCTEPRMQLRPYNSAIDKCRWYCSGYVQKPKRKRIICDTKLSVRSNTFFARSKLELWQILMFVWLWCTRNMKLIDFGPMTGMSDKTLIDWASFCRKVVFDAVIINGTKLGGPGKSVEIDESKFGKRKDNRGHQVEGTWVFGGYERESGKMFMVPVAFRSKAYLLPIIKHWIEPGTAIISDLWKSYHCLDDEGFKQLAVDHRVTFKGPDTGAHTNSIELSWRHAKESMSTAGRKTTALHGNLAKYIFWKSCNSQNINKFIEFCRLAGTLYNGLPENERLTARMSSYDELQDELALITMDEEAKLARHNASGPEWEDGDEDWDL